MTTKEIILPASAYTRTVSGSEQTRHLTISQLRRIARAKRIASWIRRKAITLSILAACVALNIYWGATGTAFLALPYIIIWDHLDR